MEEAIENAGAPEDSAQELADLFVELITGEVQTALNGGYRNG
jgi:hypothetical protein